ncbi:MAG: hypothetical protein JST50_14080 [Bacteroidetes bacterium]|jgi:hypothetical protein|nr:hypothetical protein [Bacteroidota bacterium]
MLKRKIQSLVAKGSLSEQRGFEIIYDEKASEIMGGVEACPKLASCNNYQGDCPSLVQCGIYSDGS